MRRVITFTVSQSKNSSRACVAQFHKNERLTWRLKSTPRSSDSLTVSKGQSHECPARYIDYWSCGVCYCLQRSHPKNARHGLAEVSNTSNNVRPVELDIAYGATDGYYHAQEAIFSSCVSWCCDSTLPIISLSAVCVCAAGKRDSTPTWL